MASYGALGGLDILGGLLGGYAQGKQQRLQNQFEQQKIANEYGLRQLQLQDLDAYRQSMLDTRQANTAQRGMNDFRTWATSGALDGLTNPADVESAIRQAAPGYGVNADAAVGMVLGPRNSSMGNSPIPTPTQQLPITPQGGFGAPVDPSTGNAVSPQTPSIVPPPQSQTNIAVPPMARPQLPLGTPALPSPAAIAQSAASTPIDNMAAPWGIPASMRQMMASTPNTPSNQASMASQPAPILPAPALPKPSSWYTGPVMSPLAPVGGTNVDSQTALQNRVVSDIQALQNAPPWMSDRSRANLSATLDRDSAQLNAIQADRQKSLDSVRSAYKDRFNGMGSEPDLLDFINNERSNAGINYQPRLRDMNFGVDATKYPAFLQAVENGQKTFGNIDISALRPYKDPQGNVHIVDSNGNLQQTVDAPLGDEASARIAQQNAAAKNSLANAVYTSGIKTTLANDKDTFLNQVTTPYMNNLAARAKAQTGLIGQEMKLDVARTVYQDTYNKIVQPLYQSIIDRNDAGAGYSAAQAQKDEFGIQQSVLNDAPLRSMIGQYSTLMSKIAALRGPHNIPNPSGFGQLSQPATADQLALATKLDEQAAKIKSQIDNHKVPTMPSMPTYGNGQGAGTPSAASTPASTVINGTIGNQPVTFHAPRNKQEFDALTPAKQAAYKQWRAQHGG